MWYVLCTRTCNGRKTRCSHRATLAGIEVIALAHRCCSEGAVCGALKGKEQGFERIREALPGGGGVRAYS